MQQNASMKLLLEKKKKLWKANQPFVLRVYCRVDSFYFVKEYTYGITIIAFLFTLRSDFCAMVR